MTDVKGLIERLEALSGPDRDVDRLLFNLATDGRFWPEFSTLWYESAAHRYPIDFTLFIDAALALTEKLLPGWSWYVGSVGENDMPQATVTEPVDPCRDFVGHAPTAPLAILIATLRALSPKEAAE
jgi:hypothetical protein